MDQQSQHTQLATATKDRLVWIDLEMTGLDPDTDAILEIAVIITDNLLQPQDQPLTLVIHQPESLLHSMNSWCTTHHAQSGLLGAVRASLCTVNVAEQSVFDYIARWCIPQSSPLCGNSVYQDKAFLRRWMPRVHAHLHYRIIDTSTVKELVRRWYPHHPQVQYSKPEQHRALPDIQESIRELAHYRTYFFVSGTELVLNETSSSAK